MASNRGIVLVHTHANDEKVSILLVSFMTHILISRYMIERHVMGLEQLVPLNPQEMEKGLGNGYGLNGMWYKWSGIVARENNCQIMKGNKTFADMILNRDKSVLRLIRSRKDYERFGRYLQSYHGMIHNDIAEFCSTKSGDGPMAFSEMSARDPIFWRWHKYLDDIIRQHRDYWNKPYVLQIYSKHTRRSSK